jgi:hypothetical protein
MHIKPNLNVGCFISKPVHTNDQVNRIKKELTRREIPRNIQAINDNQEHSLKAVREITDSYLEYQKEIMKSLQSTWMTGGYEVPT